MSIYLLLSALWHTLVFTPSPQMLQSVVNPSASGVAATIALDAQSKSTEGVSTVTWSHTIGGGSNTVLFVGVGYFSGSTNAVSGVTYNSVSMSQVGTESSSAFATTSVWCLASPTAGAHNVVASFGVGISASAGTAQSFSGAPHGCTTDNTAKAQGSASNAITPVSDNSWAIDFFTIFGGSLTNSSGWTNTTLTGGTLSYGAATTGPIHPAAATTDTWSSGSNSSDYLITIAP